ncbi:hypothetical protein NUW54_g2427 [Trametes sanguinea]|uniref:Uncharacterized protein n=1 Tax=Trametes sanguinea TaxID=158606 RepID=A0ACC1Q3K8_9APHY|nr:hypothetical protein NUW54_g2427 [Trametes sanguinea]
MTMTAASSLTLLLLLSLAHSARAFRTQPIPLNWTTVSACAIDNPARIIAGDVTTQAAANTPAACVASCAAQGFGYAGVEFGNECHCGNGLVTERSYIPLDVDHRPLSWRDTDSSSASAYFFVNDSLWCSGPATGRQRLCWVPSAFRHDEKCADLLWSVHGHTIAWGTPDGRMVILDASLCKQ